ncbi:4-hydroxyphenylpyruvate dioxygenase [Paraburkholderia agricolaris]|uniref:4-hydroxyphenylpyruvate dioxygenase n=1 Tax=Paraburkholderia agricolaris TaxID=2152888 RepID=A0ABW8ZXV1_9BURK
MEFASMEPEALIATFGRLGFSAAGRHRSQRITWLRQGGVSIIVNGEPGSHGERFAAVHGPSCAGMGFLVERSDESIDVARAYGANPAMLAAHSLLPRVALQGIGDSALYLVDMATLNELKSQFDFEPVHEPVAPFLRIDHVTHCVHPGHMAEWVNFYRRIFGFEEVFKFVAGDRENGFDTIAVRAPDSAACVTVIEPMGASSQIQAFIDEYHGEGIQHVALSSGDLYETVERLTKEGIEFLPAPASYYTALDERVPGHGEDIERLQRLNMLLDGANTGENPHATARLLLQIFTRKMVGPIFFEAIQRKGDTSFGEGNAKALFEAIKREQRGESV